MKTKAGSKPLKEKTATPETEKHTPSREESKLDTKGANKKGTDVQRSAKGKSPKSTIVASRRAPSN